MIRVGLAGLGYWGPNLARNFDELADLRWLCDMDPERRERYAQRFPGARATGDFENLLDDSDVDAVVIATPVVTHYDLAKRALLAGKHVFVEKPPALSGTEADELSALAEERDLVLLPGHLLLYHPGIRKLKAIVDSGELGEVLYLYGNRQNLGQIRRDENALWSLGVHDLSVILHLVDEEPAEVWARGESFLNPRVEDVVFCYLRFPSGVVAHMHLERKVTVYDKGTEQRAESYGEWRTRTGDIYIPKIPNDEPLRLECRHFLSLVAGDGDPGTAARDGAVVVRVLEQLQHSLERAPA